MKKNIVIIVSAMNMGGAQRVVSILCNYWSKNGYVVTLICTYTGGKINYYKLNKHVTLKYLTNNPFLPKNKFCNLIWKLIHLRKLIKIQNADVVISFLTRVNIASVLSTLGNKKNLILCERTWPPFSTLGKFFWGIYRILFKSVDRIVVQTNKSKAWLNRNFPNCDVNVISNPIIYPIPFDNGSLVHPDTITSQNKKVILASGRLHKYKQFDLLIKVFSQIKDKYKNWDLIILGEGEEREALNRMLFDNKLSDRVYLPGSVGNISEWYERADLFVLSSSVEGFPNVLLEAMAYGVPCISFDCDTGPRDMIQNGINGILVDPKEKEQGLLDAIGKMIGSEKLRRKFAENAIISRDTYSVSNIMRKWDSILDSY